MNLYKLKKMIENSNPWEDVHMEIFFQLCQFYCENSDPKDAFNFINKMNKISQEDVLGTKPHTVKEHMEIFFQLIEFYKENADPIEVQKLQCLTLSHIRRMKNEN